MHGDDAHAVNEHLAIGIERVDGLDRAADDHRIEAVKLGELVLPVDQRLEFLGAAGVEPVDRVFGQHVKERLVDRVNTFSQDRPLPAALAGDRRLVGTKLLAHQEATRILEVVAGNHAAERLAGRQGLTVPGVNVTDLALRHRDQRHLVDPELPAPEAKMQAAAQEINLEARLSIDGDDPAFGNRTLDRPQLLDDADPVVGDVPQAGQLANHDQAHQKTHHPDDAGWHV